MSYDCRSAFTRYLRNNEIKYTTFPGYVSIGSYHFFFNKKIEYISLTHTQAKGIGFTFPYSSPNKILLQYHRYRTYIKPYIASIEPYYPGMLVNPSGRLTLIK
jgi:hypothetical protein